MPILLTVGDSVDRRGVMYRPVVLNHRRLTVLGREPTMSARRTILGRIAAGLMVALGLSTTGCHHAAPAIPLPPPGTVPNELNKVTLPPYRIEPPDQLIIEVVIAPVTPFEKPRQLPFQPISGVHRVRLDGTIGLGIWGSPQVAGLTLDETTEMIRQLVAQRLDQWLSNAKDPNQKLDIRPERLQVVVDVYDYASKSYYVFTDGAGFGEQGYRFPLTGNECVSDAITQIGGIPPVGSKRNVWVARRSPHGGPEQILPVDWVGITQHGNASTNWQLFPGDRVYVQSDRLIRNDGTLSKILSPIERILGVTLLGSGTVNSIRGRGFGGGLGGF